MATTRPFRRIGVYAFDLPDDVADDMAQAIAHAVHEFLDDRGTIPGDAFWVGFSEQGVLKDFKQEITALQATHQLIKKGEPNEPSTWHWQPDPAQDTGWWTQT